MSGREEARVYDQSLSDSELSLLSRLIEEKTGIKTPPEKRALVQGRLFKRLRALNMGSFGEYCDFLFSPSGAQEELGNFINVITTNKTEFFREEKQFRILRNLALPQILERRDRRSLRLWSLGCSSGEEAYSLAMTLEEYGRMNRGLGYTLLCTDISTSVLEKAMKGIYAKEQVERIPAPLLMKYFRMGAGEKAGLFRVVPEIRSKLHFRYLNLMELPYSVEPADIIFFRNVLIYFYPEVQRRLLENVVSRLNPGGYLFIGLSECMHQPPPGIKKIAPSVFRKD